MRKLMMIVITAMVVTMSAKAQEAGDFAVGVNGTYSFKTESFAPGLKFQYSILRILRAELAADIWSKKDMNKSFDAFFNLHLLLHASNIFKVYPIAGIGYINTKTDGQEYTVDGVHVVIPEKIRDNVMGNAGLGIQVNASNHIAFSLEGKYQFKDDSQFCSTIGFTYIF